MKTIVFSIIIISIFTSCVQKKEEQDKKELKIIKSFSLNIPEPSGLALDTDKNLWSVSDKNGTIYRISAEGKIINELKTDIKNPEGIAVFNDSLLAVVSETTSSVFILDQTGNQLDEIPLDINGNKSTDKKKKGSRGNSGLEGIAFNSSNKHLYLVNEKEPCLLIELGSNFETGKVWELNFSGDISGIDYDDTGNCFWIVSDEDKSVFKCSTEGKVISSFSIDITKAEGIAIFGDKIFVVSDLLEKLFILEL